jgi:acetylornithine deacetylase/succinyl-diaminopimelate desuccinylase-like protein
MKLTPEVIARVRGAVNRQRLVHTVTQLVAVASPTQNAGKASDCLAQLLGEAGFAVERPTGGHAAAPAVVARLVSGRPGRTLQWDGHLDTVHLPFVPPTVDGDNIRGSGACDMKGGVAAAVEALRVLRETGALTSGSVLFTAHDLHEAPWGYGAQLDQLIREGIVGDAVLIPEPLNACLPVIGRGNATWKVTIRRAGAPVHEVMRPPDEPNVIGAGAELVARLGRLAQKLALKRDPMAGQASVFIGQIHSGEIYNQYPQECWLEGTERWLPSMSRAEMEREFRDILSDVERDSGTKITAEYNLIRDAFHLDQKDDIVTAFQECYSAISGAPLPLGPKLFVDDGNCFWPQRIPAITHGPRSGGQHTVSEWVSIDDLVRVALVYALTAIAYCDGPASR